MSLFDHVAIDDVLPGTDERRVKARSKAHDLGRTSGWMKLVLSQHLQIELCFDAIRGAESAPSRRGAERTLRILLAGHSTAEEAVLYPAMDSSDQKAHAVSAYSEQNAAKVSMAALERLDPMGLDYLDALERLERRISEHVYQEEANWFPALARSGTPALQARLSARYLHEFERYVGADDPAG